MAPDVALYLPDGRLVRTPDLWSSSPVVLNFFRHFG
jgi:hypothetical protein